MGFIKYDKKNDKIFHNIFEKHYKIPIITSMLPGNTEGTFHHQPESWLKVVNVTK